MKNFISSKGIKIALICLTVLLLISLAAIWMACDNPSLQKPVSFINDAIRFVAHYAVIAGGIWYLVDQIKRHTGKKS